MPVSNVLDDVAARCQMLYLPRWDCSSFHARTVRVLLVVVRVRTEYRVLCLLPRLCILGALLSVKVCWRKLAGTEDSPKHPEVSTEDRPARRLRGDNSVEASWEDAPDKFGFGAG